MQYKNPKVSIILPVRNGAATIGRAVQSIIHQTFENWELLIINDGSTDQTLSNIEHFQDKRINIIHQKAHGIVTALNLGLKTAKGQYVARMDADDASLPHRLQMQAALLDANTNIGVASCLVKHVGNAQQQQGYALHVAWLNTLRTPQQHLQNRFVDAPIAHPTAMVRRSVFEQHGGYLHGPFPEDFELWLRFFHHGVQFQKVPEVLFHWHDQPQRLSRTNPRYQQAAFYALKARYFARWFKQQFGQAQPALWVCGYGKTVKQRCRYLLDQGLHIAGFVDFKARAVPGQPPVVNYKQLSTLQNAFILSYVSDRQGRQAIEAHLTKLGYQPGINFLMMA